MRPRLLVLVVVLFAAVPATAKAQIVASLKSAATTVAKSGTKAVAKTPKSLAAIRRGAAPRAAAAGLVVADEGVVAAGLAVGDEGAVAAQASLRGSADDGAAAAAKAPKSTLQRLREKAVEQAEGDAKVWAIEKAQESLGPDNGASGGFSGAGYVITAVGLAVGMWALVRRKRPQ